jgi:outer membrane receptor protein involved in Fe transport
VPEVTSQGVEVDAIYQTPLDGLTVNAGVAYVEAEYGDNSGWAVGDLNVLPGSRITNAPLWTATSAFTYRWPMMGDALEGLAYIDFRYESDQNTGSGLQPVWIRPETVTVNARVGVGRTDERLGLEVWARNLTDETAGQIMFNMPLQTGAYGAFLNDPRTYGVTLTARY